MTTTTQLDGAIFFNNCTDNAEPDWTQFDALEIGGCSFERDDNGEPTGDINGGEDREDADIFTIYGHYREGADGEGLEAITDCATFDEAERVADILAERTGLEIMVTC